MKKIISALISFFKSFLFLIKKVSYGNDVDDDKAQYKDETKKNAFISDDLSSIPLDYELQPQEIKPEQKDFDDSVKGKRFGEQLFKNPHKNIENLQIKAAAAAFSVVGGDYLPLRLLSSLKYYDAFYVVNRFLSELMRFDYRTLLTNLEERESFNNFLDILFDADLILKDSKLDDLPIYHAISKRDLGLAKSYIATLKKVSPIIKELKTSTIQFHGEYLEFLKIAEVILTNWATINNKTIEEITEAYHDWLEFQQEYDEIINEIEIRIYWLNNNLPQDELEKVSIVRIAQINEIKTKIIKEAIADKEFFEQLFDQLRVELEKLDSLIEDFKAKYQSQSDSFSNFQNFQSAFEEKQYKEWEYVEKPKDPQEKFIRAYRMFEFEIFYPNYIPTLTELEKKYKKLSKKYHPDTKQYNEKADEEKFKSLNNHYDFLREQIGKGGEI